MNTPDDFSRYYAELLDGIYDCVDRIVLNAFFSMGQTGGGMRSWWRNLHGDDSQLDDKHLREMAGTFSRRLHAFCAKQGIPIIEAGSGERKHELAEPHVPKDPTFSGLFLVITGNAPAPIWEVKRNTAERLFRSELLRQTRTRVPGTRRFRTGLRDRTRGGPSCADHIRC